MNNNEEKRKINMRDNMLIKHLSQNNDFGVNNRKNCMPKMQFNYVTYSAE